MSDAPEEGAPAPDRGGSFGRDVLVTFGFTGLFAVVALCNSIVVARTVGTEGRGLYALLVAVLALAIPIGSLGLHYAAVYTVGRSRPIAQVVVLGHLWPAVVALVGFSFVGAVYLFHGGIPEATWLRVAMAAALSLPSALYVENVRGALLGQKKVVLYHSIQLVVGGGLLLLNLALLQRGVAWVLVTLIFSYGIPAALLTLLHLPKLSKAQLPSRDLIKESTSYGISAAGTLMSEAALTRLGFLLIVPVVSVADIGLLSTADLIIQQIAWGGMLAGRMMLAQSANDPDGAKSRAKVGLAVRLFTVVVICGGLFAAGAGWWIIPFVFGEDFAPAYIGMLILLPSAVSRGAYALTSQWLMGQGQVSAVMRAGWSAVAVDAVLSVIAGYFFGWLGVAVVKVIAGGVQLLLTYRALVAYSGEGFRWVLNAEDVRALYAWVRARLARLR